MKISNNNFDVGIYVAFLLVNTTFFFLDPSLYVPKIVLVASWWVLLGIIAWRGEFRFHPVFIPIFCYLLLLQLSKFNGLAFYGNLQDLLYPWGFAQAFFLLYFLSADKEIILKSIDKYITIITLLSLPSIIFYFALMMNLGIDYSLISLGDRGEEYRNYFNLAIMGDYQIMSFSGLTITRLCGMFEEPGMLGTYVGMLLVADLIGFSGKKLRKIALVILGVLSLSLTFYIFLLFFGLLIIGKYRFRQIVPYFVAVLIIILVLPGQLHDSFNKLIIGRFIVSDRGWEGDSGQIQYGERYGKYLASATALELTVGHGARSNVLDKAANYGTYQGIIYEGGVLGLFLVLVFSGYFLVWLPLRNREYLMVLLTLPWLLSLYHRAEFFSPHYLVLYALLFKSDGWEPLALPPESG